MLWPEKILKRNLITKKHSGGSKIPLPPPHNFSNGQSLIRQHLPGVTGAFIITFYTTLHFIEVQKQSGLPTISGTFCPFHTRETEMTDQRLFD